MSIADRLRKFAAATAASLDAFADEVEAIEGSDPPPVDPPPPPPPPDPEPPPPAPPPQDVSRFITTDDGIGPDRVRWSAYLNISWRTAMGDWRDASGTPQGLEPLASVTISTTGKVQIAVSNVQAVNRGLFLRYGGMANPYAVFGGRLSEAPPMMTVTLADASTRELACVSFAMWSSSSSKGADSRVEAKVADDTNALLLFDIPADAVSATVHLTCLRKGSVPGDLLVFAADPPGITYPREQTPTNGLAAEAGSDEALKGHADVIAAGDFSDVSEGALFDTVSLSPHTTHEFLPEPDGRVVYRGSFKQRDGTSYGDQNWRGSSNFMLERMPADTSDSLRPVSTTVEEMFCRLYFFLEDDWTARNDGNKMAIGWNLRLGIWNEMRYWQQTTGNGGARGTGIKLLAPPGRVNGQKTQQWEYQGHSIRMEAGAGPSIEGHPYEHLRPVTSYVYHLDQFDFNGTIERWGNAVIERGRWHCIEQQIKMNTVTGARDANGNGEAVPDGILRTWVDGVLVGERTQMRWRRHEEIGVQGPWINWFFGGKQASEVEMHYRMRDFVCATRYIGPRVA